MKLTKKSPYIQLALVFFFVYSCSAPNVHRVHPSQQGGYYYDYVKGGWCFNPEDQRYRPYLPPLHSPQVNYGQNVQPYMATTIRHVNNNYGGQITAPSQNTIPRPYDNAEGGFENKAKVAVQQSLGHLSYNLVVPTSLPNSPRGNEQITIEEEGHESAEFSAFVPITKNAFTYYPANYAGRRGYDDSGVILPSNSRPELPIFPRGFYEHSPTHHSHRESRRYHDRPKLEGYGYGYSASHEIHEGYGSDVSGSYSVSDEPSYEIFLQSGEEYRHHHQTDDNSDHRQIDEHSHHNQAGEKLKVKPEKKSPRKPSSFLVETNSTNPDSSLTATTTSPAPSSSQESTKKEATSTLHPPSISPAKGSKKKKNDARPHQLPDPGPKPRCEVKSAIQACSPLFNCEDNGSTGSCWLERSSEGEGLVFDGLTRSCKKLSALPECGRTPFCVSKSMGWHIVGGECSQFAYFCDPGRFSDDDETTTLSCSKHQIVDPLNLEGCVSAQEVDECTHLSKIRSS